VRGRCSAVRRFSYEACGYWALEAVASPRRLLGSDRLAEGGVLGSNVLHFCAQLRGIAAPPDPQAEDCRQQQFDLHDEHSTIQRFKTIRATERP
jgi:hypothetical protein